LQLLQMADIARAIRSYYFVELKLEDMPFLLAKEIPIDLSRAQEITKQIIEKIINDKSAEQAYALKIEPMTLADAMKAYPEIGEQLITAEKIALRNFPEPVRPSLKNWLADYTFNLGFEKHSSIERGNYLFHGGNAKKMTPADRQKLSFILNAYDEGTAVTVDKALKQIIFSAINAMPEQKKDAQISNPNDQNLKNIPGSQNSISFSSAQKLPYEKVYPVQSAESGPASQVFNRVNAPQPTKEDPIKYGKADATESQFNGASFAPRVKFPPIAPTRPATPMNNIVRLEPKPEPPRELPRNVVNLKDLQ